LSYRSVVMLHQVAITEEAVGLFNDAKNKSISASE
jgi:hypothetical protein